MPAIQEFAQCIVERYDYDQSAWVEAAVLEDAQIISAGIRKQCCPDGAITIGGVFAAMLNITCRMPGMTYFQVRSARLTVKHKYNSELNYTQLGVFYVTDCKRLAGDLFRISAQDAVGWTDVSANNYKRSDTEAKIDTKYGIGAFMEQKQSHRFNPDDPNDHPQNDYTNLQDWMHRLTDITARLLLGKCGIPDLVQWDNYDVTHNVVDGVSYDYANAFVYVEVIIGTEKKHIPDPSQEAKFPLYVYENDVRNLQGSARTDSPRDYYRFLSELASGFIYANENGNLTLGQFGQPEWGIGDSTTVITPDEIEADSCEIADYDIQPHHTLVKAESYRGWNSIGTYTVSPKYKESAYIFYEINEDNPFSCGWHAERSDIGIGTINDGLWWSRCDYGGSMYTIRPFHATVHKPVRFHLGQRIKFTGFAEDPLLSIVTSIQWNFRSGWKIACGGEDGRSMLDCIRATKGDRVARDLRNTITALRDQS